MQPEALKAKSTARHSVTLPKQWRWMFGAFQRYSCRYLAKHFHAVRISKTSAAVPSDHLPQLIVLNHSAWWDPLICFALAKMIGPERLHYAAIDANAVSKYEFFKKLGFFGVEPDSVRGAVDFLRTGEAILSQPDHTLWVTAQGRFVDVRTRPLGLRSGVGHLAARVTNCHIIPIAVEYSFWNERTPEALIRIGSPLTSQPHLQLTGKQWTADIEEALTKNLDILNHETMSRDPAMFESLLSGKAGIGGIYDRWRRAKAWFRGEAFDPSHGNTGSHRA